jgi:hypothetical protein
MDTLYSQIEYVAVSQLKPWAKNARTHSKKQIRQVADSIETFGFTNPVLIDAEYHILAGHARVEAAKTIGLERVPCVCLDHMTPEQKRAYVLADNKLALNAGWDELILAEELEALLEFDLDFDVTITGFEMPEIDSLLLDQTRRSRRTIPSINCPKKRLGGVTLVIYGSWASIASSVAVPWRTRHWRSSWVVNALRWCLQIHLTMFQLMDMLETPVRSNTASLLWHLVRCR